MANCCSTDYAVTGNEEDVKKFASFFKEAFREGSHKEAPKNWLGHLIVKAGGDCKKVSCRGEIVGSDEEPFRLKDNLWCYMFYSEDAWEPQTEVVDYVLEHVFPDSSLAYDYTAEEPGCDIFINTDTSGLIFSEKYLLDDGDGTWEYYSEGDEEDLLLKIEEITGSKPRNIKDAKKIVLEFRAEAEDSYLQLHEFRAA